MHNVGVLAVDVKAVLATVTPIITAYPIRTLLRSAGCLPANAVPMRGAKQICPSERRGGSGRVDPLLAPEPLAGQVAPRPEPGLSDVFVRRILLDQ
jgi:hypothetical protein